MQLRKVNETIAAASNILDLDNAYTRSCGQSWVLRAVGVAWIIMGVDVVTSQEPAPLRTTRVEPRARPPRRRASRQSNMALDDFGVSDLHLKTAAARATACVWGD